MRSQMALDWIAREQETIGIISAELRMADHELETNRIGGREFLIFGRSRLPFRTIYNS